MSHADIAIAATDAIGTPFRHQGRVVGVGLDCVGLIVYAVRAAGFQLQDHTAYWTRPDPRMVDRLVDDRLERVDGAMESGDILLFAYTGTQPQHMGIYDGADAVIHAQTHGVRRQPLSSSWRRRLHSVWRAR